MQLDADTLANVRRALDEYQRVVEAADLATDTKRTYLRHAETFVRWLAGDFMPGGSESPGVRIERFKVLFRKDRDGSIGPTRRIIILERLKADQHGAWEGSFKLDGKSLSAWWKLDALVEVRERGEWLEILRIFAPEPEPVAEAVEA